VIVATATALTTLVWRKGSRAWVWLMCTSTKGAVKTEQASRSA
jgi:hypothetical protein